MFFEVIGTEVVLPDRRGGVTRVTRPRAVVFLQKFLGNRAYFYRVAVFYFHFAHRQAAINAVCPASTNALAFSTGVVGRIPWPRFRICPAPPVFSIASRAACRIPAA